MSGFQINHIVLSGNLTRDPELRSTKGGTSVCSLRIANNTRQKVGDEWEDRPNYFDVTIWSGMGEWVASTLSKGDSVVVDGRIEWREWEDKDGNKRQAYDVTAESIIPPRDSKGGGGEGSRSGGQTASDVSADTADFDRPPPETPASSVDDDIPF